MSRTMQRPLTWGGSQLGSSDFETSPFERSLSTTELYVPELHRQAWDHLVAEAGNESHTGSMRGNYAEEAISLAALHKALYTAGGQTASTAEKIVNLACKGARCSRSEFYVALGLLLQAQQGRYLDPADAQQRLISGDAQSPSWNFANYDSSGIPASHTFPPHAARTQDYGAREEADPWSSNNDTTDNTRQFRHHDIPNSGQEQAVDSTFRGFAANKDMINNSNGNAHIGYANPHIETEGTLPTLSSLSSFRARDGAVSRQRPFSYMSDAAEINAVSSAEDPAAELPEDEVTVRLQAELEGFIVKHNVYIVSSSHRKSQVTRRYSDWVWLAECLVKRYPFRCLPVLPPKRLAMPIPGRHLSSDDIFIERRRRSLERYLKALSVHPVLREDKLVAVFFTEKKALADWRSTAPPLYLEEEGITKAVSEAERMSIPDDLDHKLTQQRKAIPDLLERWSALVALFERIVKRNDAAAADYSRLSFSLLSVVETSSKRWRPESDHRKTTEETMLTTANIFQDHSDMTSSRVAATSVSTLEGLKAQRDLLLSFRDLILRLDRLLPDPIDTIKKRIEASQKKLTSLAAAHSPTSSNQQEQVTISNAVKQDTQSIQKYLNRRLHTKKTLWEELIWFHYRFKTVEEDLQKLIRDETYFLSTLTRVWETTEMKMKMIL